jgi:beta-galactosidase
MMNKFLLVLPLFIGSLCIVKAQNSLIPENTAILKGPYQVRGKGLCNLQQEMLVTRNCYAEFGDSTWKDYSFSFSARTPVSEKEVQIWSGFRTYTRDDRYVLGFRGGEQNNIYFARQVYMGTD